MEMERLLEKGERTKQKKKKKEGDEATTTTTTTAAADETTKEVKQIWIEGGDIVL